MIRSLPTLLSALAALAILAPAPSAQTITRVVPDRGSAGDLIIIQGTNLDRTSRVDFTASVGGFLGSHTQGVAPFSVSSTEVRAIVPGGFFWAGPGSIGLSPFGSLALDSVASPVPFMIYEGTYGILQSLGNGTTQSGGQGRAVVSYDNGGVVPASPAPGFTMRLENAVPGATCFLASSAPATPPYFPVGDGTLTLDLSPIYFINGPFAADGTGDVSHPLPIPPGLSGTLALQWAVLEPLSSVAIPVSNGLQLSLP
jgi:hypothetical protein